MMSTTRRAVLETISADDAPTAHAGLWLDKYLGEPKCAKNDVKRALVEATARKEASGEGSLYEQFYLRWRRTLDGYGAQCREAKAAGRIIVGLGAEGVLETSVALHRTYGVPYVPGSALKGLARHYALDGVDGWTPEQGRVVFGNEKGEGDAMAGYVTFFDALYRPGSSAFGRALQPDVMTVHHPRYYMHGDAPPADWDDPTPVPFLSATGTYLVALRCEHAEWLAPTFSLLRLALAERGVGAKTSSGYGRLELET